MDEGWEGKERKREGFGRDNEQKGQSVAQDQRPNLPDALSPSAQMPPEDDLTNERARARE